MFHSDLWCYLTKCFLKLSIFLTNVLKLNSKWSPFDLELILRYEMFQRALEISQRLLSFYEKRDFKLIRLIWYVKLHGKHCQTRNNTKPSLCCVCKDISVFQELCEIPKNLISPYIILPATILVVIFKCCIPQK